MFDGKLFLDDDFSHPIKTKRCSECKRTLPLSKFGKASGAKYLRYDCKDCGKKMTNARKKLRVLHPLVNPEDHHCPICNASAKQAFGQGGQNLKSSWVLDHDHETGKFRGYICHNCNRGLGLFANSIERMLKAIEYLKND